MTQILGSIAFNPSDIIGRGSSSIVYRGTFRQRPAAVKKVEKIKSKLIQSEIKTLQKSDQHENIIRYFDSAEDQNFHYIALELCNFTLRDYVTNSALKAKLPLKSLIDAMLDGMRWLHSFPIVHRDIKPTNVLLQKTHMDELQVKISDFGFSKDLQVSGSQMSIIPDESSYWTSPEMNRGRYNAKTDVHSMGCLIFYLANNGSVSKLSDGTLNLQWSSSAAQTSEGVLLINLVSMMTKFNPDDRPTFSCLRFYPYFWIIQKIIDFFLNVWDRIKVGDHMASQAKICLQENVDAVIGSDWTSRLEGEVVDSLAYRGPRHNYGVHSISELLRALRNKADHYHEMREAAKRIYGSFPEGYTNYWLSKFPNLLHHVYVKIHQSGLHQDPSLAQYYPNSQNCDLVSIRT